MASRMDILISYRERPGVQKKTAGGDLRLNKFRVKKVAPAISNKIRVEFEGESAGWLGKAHMDLLPELAIALARNLLSVAEGYVTQSESEVA